MAKEYVGILALNIILFHIDMVVLPLALKELSAIIREYIYLAPLIQPRGISLKNY
ncbi:hypothetical protein D3C80_2064600 [compost metagenome]